ncbi:MAG: alanine--tRNA ligase, partial [Synergistes sp.]|nr:alanine--tRNA ligase [Synergistes sp.]
EDIIPWAWEFLTERVGLDPNRLYATVYLDDDEAFDIWHKKVGLPKERIFRLGEDDNFWAAGPVGPCGPCSEIIYDQGEEYSCGKPTCTVGCDCDRYLEIWNLVFMQYNRDKEGNLTPLPAKNIDTGMGLERLTSVVQGVPNDFETDLFRPIMEKACELVNVKYGADKKHDMAVKVISDHIRASAFMIADGILPTNDGTGYVLRRLIRRCVRYGRLLGIDRPFLTELLPVVRESIGDEYGELIEQASAIEQVLSTEEERFSHTLSQGSDLMDSEIEKLTAAGKSVLPGDVAFVLYDTFGFPLELTEEMCEERGITVNKEGFEAAMEEQRERARASSKQTSSVISKNIYTELADKIAPSPFCGYTEEKCEAEVKAVIVDGELAESAAPGTAA